MHITFRTRDLFLTKLKSDKTDSAAGERFLEQVSDARLCDVYRYWDGLRCQRFAPAYAEIDPLDIPRLLSCLLITEVEPVRRGRRYRYRLCGTEVEEHFGSAMRGRYIDTLMKGSYLAYIVDLYDRVVDGRSPIYSVSTYGQRALNTKRLMLPLSSDGHSVDMVLAGQVFYRSSGLPQTVLAVQSDFEPHFEQASGE